MLVKWSIWNIFLKVPNDNEPNATSQHTIVLYSADATGTYPTGEGNSFLEGISKLLSDYTTSHSRTYFQNNTSQKF